MRLNIRKLQSGGLVYRPLTENAEGQPDLAPQQQQAAQQPSGLDKDILKSMLGEGVTNDVMAYSETINNAFSEYSTLDPIMRNSAYGRSLVNTMKGDWAALNMLKRNKQILDRGAEQAKDQKALDEIAITSFGVVVQDNETGQLREVSHEDFANIINSGNKKYRALTNAELLNEREYNRNLAGDTISLNSLSSSIGMPIVKEQIWKILQYVNENKSSNTRIGNTARALGDLKANADKGIFDVEKMESIESNKQQMEEAVNATWLNMEENSKSLLKARAVILGAKPGEVDKVAKELMVSLLSPKSKTVVETKISEKYNEGATKSMYGDPAQPTAELGYWESFVEGLGSDKMIELNKGTSYSFVATGKVLGPFRSSAGATYGMKALSKMPELDSALDMDNVYIGNQKISRSSLSSLIYSGGKVEQMELPAVIDGENIRPDLDMAKRLGDAEKELAKKGGDKAAVTVKETIYSKHGIQTDGRGKPNVRIERFAMFTGLVNKGVTDDADEDAMLRNISEGKLGDQAISTYENAYYEGAGKEERKALEKQYKDDIYQGTVFIPVSGSRFTTRYADKQNINIPKSATNLDSMSYTDRGTDKGYQQKASTYSISSL